jgi:DNA invertase Pin-like site-specific DNA recombinase
MGDRWRHRPQSHREMITTQYALSVIRASWNGCCANARLNNNSNFSVFPGEGCCINPLSLPTAWQHVCTTFFMLVGYARVSKTDQQDTRAQVKALKEAGCKRIFEESASGGRWDRPELHRALDQLREGDILVVWKLDRLSRSLKDLLHILEKISDAGAGFRSLTENIDTSTPAGRMMLQMIGVFAEFERSMVRERTRMGLQAARERGRIGGRKAKLKPNQVAEVGVRARNGK